MFAIPISGTRERMRSVLITERIPMALKSICPIFDPLASERADEDGRHHAAFDKHLARIVAVLHLAARAISSQSAQAIAVPVKAKASSASDRLVQCHRPPERGGRKWRGCRSRARAR